MDCRQCGPILSTHLQTSVIYTGVALHNACCLLPFCCWIVLSWKTEHNKLNVQVPMHGRMMSAGSQTLFIFCSCTNFFESCFRYQIKKMCICLQEQNKTNKQKTSWTVWKLNTFSFCNINWTQVGNFPNHCIFCVSNFTHPHFFELAFVYKVRKVNIITNTKDRIFQVRLRH